MIYTDHLDHRGWANDYTADDVFFTSTLFCIMPAVKFNGLLIADGRVGPVTQQLLAVWKNRVGHDTIRHAQHAQRQI